MIEDAKQKLENALKKLKTVEEMTAVFKSDNGDGLITLDELKSISFGEKTGFNGVEYVRTFNPEKEVYFITDMNPDKAPDKFPKFGFQWHNCKEDCKVLAGHLIELTTGRTYEAGETVRYNPFQVHKPASKILSKFGVHFFE